jgi:hypothetical protein
MKLTLTDATTITINEGNTAFNIHTIVEDEIVDLAFKGTVNSIDSRIGCDWYIIDFAEDGESHRFEANDFEIPMLDGEPMSI